jgi:hypothetical protein
VGYLISSYHHTGELSRTPDITLAKCAEMLIDLLRTDICVSICPLTAKVNTRFRVSHFFFPIGVLYFFLYLNKSERSYPVRFPGAEECGMHNRIDTTGWMSLTIALLPKVLIYQVQLHVRPMQRTWMRW